MKSIKKRLIKLTMKTMWLCIVLVCLNLDILAPISNEIYEEAVLKHHEKESGEDGYVLMYTTMFHDDDEWVYIYYVYFEFWLCEDEDNQIYSYVNLKVESEVYYEDKFGEKTSENYSYSMRDEKTIFPIVTNFVEGNTTVEISLELELSCQEFELIKPELKMILQEKSYVDERLEYQKNIFEQYQVDERGGIVISNFQETEEQIF